MEDDLLQKRIGEVARAAREGLGLTQAQVARQVGIAPGVYGRIERGGMMPSVPTLRQIAVALGVPPDALLDMAPLEVPTSGNDFSPEVRKVVGLLRTWPEAKVQLGCELLRVLDPVPVPDSAPEK
jgi:transcriptional regulator with XRE-family HTH domain